MKNMQNLTICQVSLSLMILDICKFCCLYILVLFAFSCGNHWPTSTHWLFIFIRRDIMGKQCQFWCKNCSCSPAGVDLKVGPNFYRKIIFVRDESAALVLCWSREETMSWCEYFFHSRNIVLGVHPTSSWSSLSLSTIWLRLLRILQDSASQRPIFR